MESAIEAMLRRLSDFNTRYAANAGKRGREPMLSETDLALACAEALTNVLGCGWVRSRLAHTGQLPDRRRYAGGQSLVAVFAVRGDAVVCDLGISGGVRPSPGSAFPDVGKWSGVIREETVKDYSRTFINSFHDQARHRLTLADALAFVRQHFDWEPKNMKLVKVNIDERGRRPSTLRPQTLRRAGEMLEDLLERSEQRGQFLLRVRHQVQSRSGARIKVKEVAGQSVRVMVRPGDNSTAWEYDLACPGTVDPNTLADRLRLTLDRDRTPEDQWEDEPAAALANAPGATPVALPAVPAPVAAPAAEAPHAANGATTGANGAASTADVLQLLLGAMERRQSRERQLGELETKRKALAAELETVQVKIKEVEDQQASLLAEEENDAQGQAVNDVLQALSRVFTKPTA